MSYEHEHEFFDFQDYAVDFSEVNPRNRMPDNGGTLLLCSLTSVRTLSIFQKSFREIDC